MEIGKDKPRADGGGTVCLGNEGRCANPAGTGKAMGNGEASGCAANELDFGKPGRTVGVCSSEGDPSCNGDNLKK